MRMSSRGEISDGLGVEVLQVNFRDGSFTGLASEVRAFHVFGTCQE